MLNDIHNSIFNPRRWKPSHVAYNLHHHPHASSTSSQFFQRTLSQSTHFHGPHAFKYYPIALASHVYRPNQIQRFSTEKEIFLEVTAHNLLDRPAQKKHVTLFSKIDWAGSALHFIVTLSFPGQGQHRQ
jgi:hypothetical protein